MFGLLFSIRIEESQIEKFFQPPGCFLLFSLATYIRHKVGERGDFSIGIWMFPKILGFPSKSSIFIGFSIIFTIHFGGNSPIFWISTYISAQHISKKPCLSLMQFWIQDPVPARKRGGDDS